MAHGIGGFPPYAATPPQARARLLSGVSAAVGAKRGGCSYLNKDRPFGAVFFFSSKCTIAAFFRLPLLLKPFIIL